MQTIHDKIHKYINGELSEVEIHQLWINFLHQPLWYDYFITELTAQKKKQSNGSTPANIDVSVVSRLPEYYR